MKEIKIPKELYSFKCIKRAVEDYDSLAEIVIGQDKDSWIVSFSNCKYDELRTSREFENYLIELENQ